ncbi:MAG: SRPBCC family protein [Anaerolineaceae bacterium]|nr:SRPBCC family protein [Anaerolineaceae bacterium]
MNVLDHRILIDNRSSAIVWEQISDISKNPAWQVDCTGISFLSSRRSGAGMRWRYTSKNRREYIVETTAWYDGVGYEYTIVDGASYSQCQGRVRLQEIAEGTIVRWTFSYEMKGVLGNLRNSLNHRRTLEKDMIDSLKALWRYMNQVEASNPEFEARSLMRDALNYEARSQYKPRHPSVVENQHPAEADEPFPAILPHEPPIEEGDTKPHLAVPATPLLVDSPETDEDSDFAQSLPEQEDHLVSTQDQQEVKAVSASTMPEVIKEPEIEAESTPIPEAMPEADPTTPSVAEPAVNVPSETVAPESNIDEAEPAATPEDSQAPEAPRLTSITDTLPGASVNAVPPTIRTTEEDIQRLDTREISVFEYFGLPKPSETQEMRPVHAEPSSQEIPIGPPLLDPHAPTVVEHPLRQGLRLLLRRRHAKLRRPS